MSEVGRVSSVVKKYRALLGEKNGNGGKPVSASELARQISAALAPHGSVIRASVASWERGETSPLYWQMLCLYLIGAGWARNFALDMLCAMRPELWLYPDALSYSQGASYGSGPAAESGKGQGHS